jgi:outer membrane protein OmpA-like peptidoglycan-associated protein
MNQAITIRLAMFSSAIASAVLAMGAARAQGAPLHAPAARITDQAIAADHAGYRAVQQRIKQLNDKGIRVGDYYLSKAQCWLDVSVHEYTRNDRSAFPQQALEQSAAIVSALEAGSQPNPGDDTPLVNDATRLRDDLWARFAAGKTASGFACAAQKIACGEVELVHAGNEFKQQGWRHANPYIQMAEDFAQDAGAAAAACTPVRLPLADVGPAVVVAPASVVVERLTLSADALFRFDKSALSDLLPAGRARIDGMMEKLTQVYVQVSRISLVGHTDRLGAQAYNQGLSERRAATLREYMMSKGFVGEIAVSGKGAADQVAACTGVAPHGKLIECLQPNRRVDIEVTGVKR